MGTKTIIKSDLIAPCGMNCALCMARLIRVKNLCPGCRGDEVYKPKNCVNCVIVNCDHFQETNHKYCSSKCENFPCTRLKNLDQRYRTKYHMSMIDNLTYIEEYGIRAFVKNEKVRWTCLACGGTICVHRGFCSTCGTEMSGEK